VAGAQDAAKELGYEITPVSMSHQGRGATAYAFSFDAHGQAASRRVPGDAPNHPLVGTSLREYARREILDALHGNDLHGCEQQASRLPVSEHRSEVAWRRGRLGRSRRPRHAAHGTTKLVERSAHPRSSWVAAKAANDRAGPTRTS
jgi:hypothetical protein